MKSFLSKVIAFVTTHHKMSLIGLALLLIFGYQTYLNLDYNSQNKELNRLMGVLQTNYEDLATKSAKQSLENFKKIQGFEQAIAEKDAKIYLLNKDIEKHDIEISGIKTKTHKQLVEANASKEQVLWEYAALENKFTLVDEQNGKLKTLTLDLQAKIVLKDSIISEINKNLELETNLRVQCERLNKEYQYQLAHRRNKKEFVLKALIFAAGFGIGKLL